MKKLTRFMVVMQPKKKNKNTFYPLYMTVKATDATAACIWFMGRNLHNKQYYRKPTAHVLYDGRTYRFGED